MIGRADIEAAYERILPHIRRTPVMHMDADGLPHRSGPTRMLGLASVSSGVRPIIVRQLRLFTAEPRRHALAPIHLDPANMLMLLKVIGTT